MKNLNELMCAILGHKDYEVVTKVSKSERSVWGWFRCSRCGRDRCSAHVIEHHMECKC